MLTRGMVERRAQAGAEVNALIARLAADGRRDACGSYAFVIAPDRIGSIPFARNAQGGLMSPPVQPRSLSPRLVVQLADELPEMATDAREQHHRPLKSEPLEDVTANPQTPGTTQPLAVPDHYFCWSLKSHKLEPMPLEFEAGFRDWNEVWARGLAAAGATHDRAQRSARHHAPLRAELEAAMARVHARGWYILGPEVEAFEREFAAYVGAPNASPSATAPMPSSSRCGRSPSVRATRSRRWRTPGCTRPRRFARGSDTRLRRDRCIDAADGPRRARAALRRATRALIVTHLYGRLPTSIARRIARERGVALIEDCAQAHGARSRRSACAGLTATLGCFSFYPTKNLGALGDAGAVVTATAIWRRNCARCGPTAGAPSTIARWKAE
jgi:hypothetical protein